MLISPTLKEVLETAESKALATCGESGLNVVPVSMIKVNDDGTIWLFNLFMNKSVRNLTSNPTVALTAWYAFKGIQLKGSAEYFTEGDIFDEAVSWTKTQNPNRVVRGLIIITPSEAFDISPGGAFNSPLLLEK